MRVFFVLLLSIFSFFVRAEDSYDQEKIKERIRPVGEVRVQAQPSVNDKKALKQDKGKSVYEHYCIICHQDGVAGSPKFGNEKDWQARMNGKKISDLVASAVKGLNAMPSKGTCTE